MLLMFQNNPHINILAKLDEFAFAFLLLQDDNVEEAKGQFVLIRSVDFFSSNYIISFYMFRQTTCYLITE